MASDLVMPHYGLAHMGLPIVIRYQSVTVPFMGTIGDRIRKLRKAKKMTQPVLAKLIGIDQSTLSDIERGAGFSAETLMRLADELETTAEFIMRGRINLVSPALRRAQEAVGTLTDEERLALFSAIQQPGLPDKAVEERIPATKPSKRAAGWLPDVQEFEHEEEGNDVRRVQDQKDGRPGSGGRRAGGKR